MMGRRSRKQLPMKQQGAVRCRRVTTPNGKPATVCVFGRKYGFFGTIYFPSGRSAPLSVGNSRTVGSAFKKAMAQYRNIAS